MAASFFKDLRPAYHVLLGSPNESIFAIKGKELVFLGYLLLTRPSLQSQGEAKTAQVSQNYRILTRPS